MTGGPPRPANKLAVPLAPLLTRLEESSLRVAVEDMPTAGQAIQRLEDMGKLLEACRLTAHALPKREAVWWACMCGRAAPDTNATPEDLAAVEAAEVWVRRPDEATRRAAMVAAERANFRSAEAWAAVGAFWSGGSMAPEGQPVVPPGEHLTGLAIGGGVVLAAVRLLPQHLDARLARFLASAREIARGGAGRMPAERTS